MKVLIVLAWILGYIVFGVITTVVSYKYFDQDRDEAVAIGICWIITVPIFIILFMAGMILMWIESGTEKIWDWVETKKK